MAVLLSKSTHYPGMQHIVCGIRQAYIVTQHEKHNKIFSPGGFLK